MSDRVYRLRVMEQTNDAVMVPMDAGWSDIGSWSSLADLSEQDDNGNTAIGDVKMLASENSYVRSEDKLVAAIGVRDLVIVSTKDAVLVASKDDAQDVKRITQELRDVPAMSGRFTARFFGHGKI